ncbi:ribonuclease E [Polymorphobacter multimanifer]|uniref:Ribonuclease E n=1 Tax=Polymorphobacter multimanifer TaxID=1070431 RepID=A0A841L038_9SPHN|nr:Rne/Rng family ribonuclease [Polymorphobacter multimanifer]MBB6226189.1 ribonuclease E [Polymorphobacter multimanifer]
MSLRMLIDARHPEETRVAVVNGQRIEEFDFEAADRRQLKGNIYLAKVTRVEPSLQAAFVEYGGNRHGFLAFSEIHPDYYQIPREDREALLREEAELAADHDDHHDDEDEDEGEGEGVSETGGQHDEPSDALRRKRQSLRRRYKIQEVIRRRQVLLIQVVKEERGSKGAALTTYLSLAGRYCVLMPNTAHGGGISRKIANPADRKRLKTIMADLKLPQGMGAIVRTAGLKRSADDIRRDFDYLTRLWDEIRERTLGSMAPALIHQDSDLIKRAIRDVYNRQIEQILVEGPEGYEAATRFMSMLMPGHVAKVVEYVDNVPLFQRFGVEAQLEGMYQPVVQLKSGGYIVINPTEALVSIDINSGRSTREYGIEETATKTNLEAAEEIGRQLRLRDMAGLVVIDFIDMENSGNNRKVEKAMKEAMKNDRARVQIGRISSFGLMEMSRQRLRTGVLEASTHICPMCEGTGMVRSVASAALAALRALEAEALRGRASDFTLRASEAVAVYVLNKKRIELAELEELYGVTIHTVPDDDFIGPNFVIDAAGSPPSKKVEMAALPAVVRIEDDPDDVADADDDSDGEDDGEAREERRERGRDGGRERGGRGKRRRRRERDPADAEAGDAPEGEEAPEAAEDADASEEIIASAADETPAERDRKRRRRGRRGRRNRDGTMEAGDNAAAATDEDADGEVTAEAPAAAETEEARPRGRRRRGGRGGSRGAETAAAAAPEEEAIVEAPAAPEAVEADAPKPRGRRRKADAVIPEAVVVEEPVPAPVPAPLAEEPAAKPRRARKPKAAEAAPEPVVETPVAEPAEPEAAPKPKGRRKAAPKVAEAEAVEAPAEAEAEAPAAEAAPASPRKGWWQRTFG